jgi:hypothetical protein
MKAILISILISCSILPSVYAATLVPSLTAQIARQEQINIKNAYTARLAEQANKRVETRKKLLAIKNKKLGTNTISVASVPSVASIATSISSTTRPSLQVAQPSNIPSPSGIDMSRVRSTWLGWYNDTRWSLGIGSYSYDTRLDSTAYDWNQIFMSGKWLNHHRRNIWDSYYSFATIDRWFITRGINPIVISRAKHTENVGYGYYSCSLSDCTDAMIRSIRTTFDFFMSEKGKAYDAHYRSIIQPNFSKIGLSIIVVPNERRYYLTVHYITE